MAAFAISPDRPSRLKVVTSEPPQQPTGWPTCVWATGRALQAYPAFKPETARAEYSNTDLRANASAYKYRERDQGPALKAHHAMATFR